MPTAESPDNKWRRAQLPEDLEIPAQWEGPLHEVRGGWQRVIILGATDTGKSTLCWWLARELSEDSRTAVVDADVGQSRIGPPAAVGWRFTDADSGEFCFVGEVTPAPHPADCVAGTIRLVQRAEAAGADSVVVDTSGYVDGPGAISLKKAKIELLAPVLVIALGETARLAPLTRPFATDEGIKALHLPAAECCGEKSRDQRGRWREALFAEWLRGSEMQQIDWADKAVINLPDERNMREHGPEEWRGLLLGLLDGQRLGLALGLLRGIDYRNERLTILAPPEAQAAQAIQFGRLRLEPDGTAMPGRVSFV